MKILFPNAHLGNIPCTSYIKKIISASIRIHWIYRQMIDIVMRYRIMSDMLAIDINCHSFKNKIFILVYICMKCASIIVENQAQMWSSV